MEDMEDKVIRNKIRISPYIGEDGMVSYEILGEKALAEIESGHYYSDNDIVSFSAPLYSEIEINLYNGKFTSAEIR